MSRGGDDGVGWVCMKRLPDFILVSARLDAAWGNWGLTRVSKARGGILAGFRGCRAWW